MASVDSLYAANSTYAPVSGPVAALYKKHTPGEATNEGGSQAIARNKAASTGSTGLQGNAASAAYYATPQGQAGLQNAQAQYDAFSQRYGISQSDPNFLNAFNQYHVAATNAAQGGFLDHFLATYLPAATVGLATAGIGSAVAAPLVGTVGATAAGAIGGAAQGAIAGAGTGVLTGGNIGKDALMGGVGGGVAGGIAGSGIGTSATKAISDTTGVNSTVAGGIVKTGIGAAKGAVTGAVNGQGVGAGAAGGAINAASGAVQGSILGGLGTVFNSGTTNQQTSNPNLTNPGNPQMSDDFDPNAAPTFQDPNFDYQPGNMDFSDPSAPGYNPGNTQLYSDGTDITPGGSYGSADTSGGSSGGASSGLLASLLKYFGGSGNSGSAGQNLLAQLLGAGSSLAGGSMQHGAAVNAANTFAGKTAFNPYSVNTAGGSSSFDGTTANSSLSPQAQQQYNNLGALGNQSAQSLQAGQGAAANQYYNQLQAQQAQGNSRLMGSNFDAQFGKGILGSTAGQYQTQGINDSINNQNLQDSVLSNNFANTQQQNQLQQLTGSLNGMNQLNAGQLAQQGQGAQIGSAASSANNQAYQPSLAANSGTPIGNLLATLGQTQNAGSNSNALQQYFASLGNKP